MTSRSQLRRDTEPLSKSDALSAIPELTAAYLRRSADELRCDLRKLILPAAVFVLCIIAIAVPGLIVGNAGTYDVHILYAALGMFYTVLFCAMSLSSGVNMRLRGVGLMFYAPVPPFLLMLVRTLQGLLPMILGSGVLFIMSFGLMSALFGVGSLFFMLCVVGFAVTVVLGTLVSCALRVLEVIFGVRHFAVCILFSVPLAVWVLVSVVLTPSFCDCGRLCEALVSPVGTTVPVGGWLCSIIMGICEGSVSAAVPGALLCPAFGALVVMLLCVMNASQYDLALISLIDAECSRGAKFGDRFGGMSARLIHGLSARISDICAASGKVPASVSAVFALLWRISAERVRGSSRRLFAYVNISVICFVSALLFGRTFGVGALVFAAVIFAVLRTYTADVPVLCGGLTSVTLFENAVLALFELGGCVIGAVISIFPASIIIDASAFISGASVGAAVLAVVSAVALVFVKRILRLL